MASKNVVTKINFTKRVNSFWLVNAENYALGDVKTIVVNVGTSPVEVDTPPPTKHIQPRTSTILKGVTVVKGDSVLCFEIPDNLDNIGGVILDTDWQQLSKTAHSFPADVPLFKSAQFNLGQVRFDPFLACGQSEQQNESKMADFVVKVNLWFCPSKTNCSIHNVHASPEILEVHTQIYGTGRMQKYHKQDFGTLYEDVIMDPGMTHLPFAGVKDNGSLYYGWHQYYGETDCIWMAIEYHPASS